MCLVCLIFGDHLSLLMDGISINEVKTLSMSDFHFDHQLIWAYPAVGMQHMGCFWRMIILIVILCRLQLHTKLSLVQWWNMVANAAIMSASVTQLSRLDYIQSVATKLCHTYISCPPSASLSCCHSWVIAELLDGYCCDLLQTFVLVSSLHIPRA